MRLCGGEGKLSRPSDPRWPAPPEIRTLSPLPFKKLGPETYAECNAVELGVFFSLFARVPLDGVDVLFESLEPGLVGSRLVVLIVPPREGRPIRDAGFGGCGKAPILIDRLMVLSEAKTLEAAVLSVGTVGVETACCPNFESGRDPFDGVLSLDGVVPEGRREDIDGDGRLFLVFTIGIGGRAEVGGSKGGCRDLGSAVAAIVYVTIQ